MRGARTKGSPDSFFPDMYKQKLGNPKKHTVYYAFSAGNKLQGPFYVKELCTLNPLLYLKLFPAKLYYARNSDNCQYRTYHYT